MSGRPDLDLRGHDHHSRRRCLFAALRGLRLGDEVVVITALPDELHWLRYEIEAGIPHRYRWLRRDEADCAEVHTVVQRAA